MTLVVPAVFEESCTTRLALERIMGKWRILVVYALFAGPQRPAELRRRLPGVTQKMLTETLRGLAADGLVDRHVIKTSHPQHVEYGLTEFGLTLEKPLAAICDWATESEAGPRAYPSTVGRQGG